MVILRPFCFLGEYSKIPILEKVHFFSNPETFLTKNGCLTGKPRELCQKRPKMKTLKKHEI